MKNSLNTTCLMSLFLRFRDSLGRTERTKWTELNWTRPVRSLRTVCATQLNWTEISDQFISVASVSCDDFVQCLMMYVSVTVNLLRVWSAISAAVTVRAQSCSVDCTYLMGPPCFIRC